MGQKIITLSGAATDVLYALFFRGALQSGDLPAKSGASELRELGFAETRHTATEYQKENYFTFLTAEGQEFAIKHLVNTRFGVPAGGYIGRTLVPQAESSPFYVVGGVVHIKQSVIQPVNNEESCLSRFISERVGEALREATRPGGIIHAATKR